MKRLFYFLIVLSCTLWNCGNDKDENYLDSDENKPEYVWLDVSTTQINSSAKGIDEEIFINCNYKWEITCDSLWCSPEEKQGFGKKTVKIKITSSNTEKERKTNIYVKSDNIERIIEVIQKGKDILIFPQNKYDCPIEGKVFEITLNTNVDYKIIIPDSVWIEQPLKDLGYDSESNIIIRINPNKEYGNNRIGILIVQQLEGSLTDTVEFYQAGFLDFEKEQLSKLYESTGGNNWKNNTNWNSDKPINEWYGIKTDKCGAISEILLSDNNLTGEFIFESCCGTLQNVYCAKNQLTSIKIARQIVTNYKIHGGDAEFYFYRNSHSLSKLNCEENKISKIDIPDIYTLNCSKNNLSTLDLSQMPTLSWLACSDNQITTLDISACINLNEVYCGDSRLTLLKVSPNNSSLYFISCKNNLMNNNGLNQLYNSLPSGGGALNIDGNIGTGDRKIATRKGWKFTSTIG